MGMTVQDAFKGTMPQDETELVSVSDELWSIGPLAEIRRQASPALFNLHVAMNAIGSWKGDGWHEIISAQPQLVPHIPAAMEALGLVEISEAFQCMIAVFPDFVVFSDDSLGSDLHYDAVNFLHNARLKVSDERLGAFGREERQNDAGIAVLYDAPPEFAPVLQEAFAKMLALSEAGDTEAEYMVAWCRLNGLGTEVDEAVAIPVMMAKADTGDVTALFFAASISAKLGDKERAIELLTRAADKGDARSMWWLSGFHRDRDEREMAATWIRKAAEAGSYRPIEEMIGIAEAGGDWKEIVHWVTVAMIRTPDPAVAYRCRMIIAYVGNDEDEEELLQAMEAGEHRHLDHPVSFVDAEE